MTPNPILKVLFTLKSHKVKCLLIGGQACIIYGAIEFSRDSDFMVLCNDKNLKQLKEALAALKAKLIYIPPLEIDYLERGHACHFRCAAGNVQNLRIDIISKLRGCESFEKLWKRRTKVTLKKGMVIDIIGLEDLVQSKKTQRDKDWLMLKRLVENDYFKNKDNPTEDKIKWWLFEARSADLLIELANQYPKIAKECMVKRPLLSEAITSSVQKLNLQLQEEEFIERQRDRKYWQPLRKELEDLRRMSRCTYLSR